MSLWALSSSFWDRSKGTVETQLRVRYDMIQEENNKVYERRPCLASVPIKQTKLMNRQKKLTTT